MSSGAEGVPLSLGLLRMDLPPGGTWIKSPCCHDCVSAAVLLMLLTLILAMVAYALSGCLLPSHWSAPRVLFFALLLAPFPRTPPAQMAVSIDWGSFFVVCFQ